MKNNILYITVALSVTLCSFAQEVTEPLLSAQQLKVADSLYALGDYPKAIALFEQDSRIGSQLKLAQAYKKVGMLDEALATYQKTVTKEPSNALATYNYATTLLNEKQYEKAAALFNILIKAYPENLEYVYQMGLAGEGQNDMLALPIWTFIIMRDSLHLNANYKMALLFTKTGKFDTAAPYVKKGLAQQPNSRRFLTLQGLSFFYKKDYHNTITIFEKLLELGQSNEQVHEKLAVSYKKTNQFEKSLATYTLLLEEYDAKNPTWHFEIGTVHKALGNVEKAIEHISTSKEILNPSLASHNMVLATIYKNQGDYKKVFQLIEEATQDEPSNEMLQYQLAIAADNYFKDKKSVLALYEKYLSTFPKGSYSDLANQRIADLKKEIHLGEE